MARKLFIAGNWKMNHAAAATADTIRDLVAKLSPTCKSGCCCQIDCAICPPFTSLAAAVEAAAGSCITIGAQNIHWAETGAFTGEISAAMLKEIPVTLAIIGHSERRQYFGETDATVNQRLRAALDAGIQPIVCVGELLGERQAGETEAVVERQIRGAFEGVSAEEMAGITIAYEPVWAIGTGETATPDQAQAVHKVIRTLLATLYSQDVADVVRIQYGGSVKPGNVAELMAQPDIDGALVGGASLKADDFSQLIKNASA